MEDRQDRKIDNVLNALRQAEPGAGMRDRILASLHDAESAQRSSRAWQCRWPSLALFERGAALWLVAAALLVAAGGTLLLRPGHSARRDRQGAIQAGTRGSLASAADAPGALRALDEVQRTGYPRQVDEARQLVPQVLLRRGIRPADATSSHVSNARHGEPSKEGDRSFPAPPIPLTEQERLLLRLVRHELPIQLAQLTAPAREAAFQREKQEVTTFFAPPALLVDPQDHQVQPQNNGQQ